MILTESSLHLIDPAQVHDPESDLTTDELHRADAFRFSKDRVSWMAYRAALRRVLGTECGLPAREVPLTVGENGKPELSPPFSSIHFNLSHCDDLGLIAIGPCPVGIDLEPLSRASSLLVCEDAFCHPDEISRLPRDPMDRAIQLLAIWTAKEAVLKALGTGLLHPPEGIFIDFQNHIARSDQYFPGLDAVRFEKITSPGLKDHSAFLAAITK
jgi:phosphopantetheinyl transferase